MFNLYTVHVKQKSNSLFVQSCPKKLILNSCFAFIHIAKNLICYMSLENSTNE